MVGHYCVLAYPRDSIVCWGSVFAIRICQKTSKEMSMKIEIKATHSDGITQTISSDDCQTYDGIKTLLRAFLVLVGCEGIKIEE